jgi:chromosome segregation ATPase
MTKEQYQKELLEKVKPGVKPSDLRKLKKSKSADDLPEPSPSRLSELETKNQELEKQLTLTSQALDELTKIAQGNVPPASLLKEQLTEKQKEVENLREKLETTNLKLTLTTAELDNSLFARAEATKQFGKVYAKLQQIKQELNENVDQASDELLNQDQIIGKLREQKQKAQVKIQALEKDLQLTSKLAQMRKVPYYSSDDN